MGVSVEDDVDWIPGERLFQPAGAKVGIDLQRFPYHRCHDRRVVQQRHPSLGPQLSQGGLQLQRFIQRLADKLLDQPLAPGPEGSAPEPPSKPLDPGETDTEHLV
jgi:hypothetical protein